MDRVRHRSNPSWIEHLRNRICLFRHILAFFSTPAGGGGQAVHCLQGGGRESRGNCDLRWCGCSFCAGAARQRGCDSYRRSGVPDLRDCPSLCLLPKASTKVCNTFVARLGIGVRCCVAPPPRGRRTPSRCGIRVLTHSFSALVSLHGVHIAVLWESSTETLEDGPGCLRSGFQ
jgi:hypothetical protein